jgi:alpha-ketoglutarate-dependent taurine dioxygenase
VSPSFQLQVQPGEFAAQVETRDFGALAEDEAATRELLGLLNRYLVLHFKPTEPLSKQAVGTFAFSLGFPKERRNQGRSRPGAKAQTVPGFEFVGDFGHTAQLSVGAPRPPSYIETLHCDGISAYSLQVNVEVPPAAPNLWTDMRANYRLLPARLKQIVETHWALHAVQPPAGTALEDFPAFDPSNTRRHPLVIKHFNTGEPLLYLPKNPASRIEGLSEGQGREVLAELWEFVERSPARYEVQVCANELVVWDGLGTMHTNPPYPRDRNRTIWFFVVPAKDTHLTAYAHSAALS